MKLSHTLPVLACAAVLSACGQQQSEEAEAASAGAASEPTAAASQQVGDVFDIAPGLTARILQTGYGRAAVAGDYVDVHYTGWLYDEEAEARRGNKFDSSVDRGERFGFLLGAGQVIKGWDQGVDGMLIGEKRELTLAPEMAYGERGAGNVIPPGATLVFEVELFGLEGPSDTQ